MPKVEQWLVVDLEFAPVECAAKVCLQFHSGLQLRCHGRLENPMRPTSGSFRPIKRHVGMLEHRVRAYARSDRSGYANAGSNGGLVVFEFERRCKRIRNAFSKQLDAFEPADLAP